MKPNNNYNSIFEYTKLDFNGFTNTCEIYKII